MNAKVFNIALMAFWLALCAGMLTREWWMPPGLLDRVNTPQTPLVVMVAGILAVWNFMRFYFARRPTLPTHLSPQAQEYRRRIRSMSGDDPRVTDPQFQFDKPPEDRH